jgi:Uma2 family endonuclease
MVQELSLTPEITYPDSDGQPMADNTQQFRWIVVIKENLELLFAEDENVFVAGDLLWYPVEGDNRTRKAPDAMVVFGRPKGDRGSYKQWEEDDIAPQVVFEVLSPGNRLTEMMQKLEFYERFGIEEYYVYDPDRVDLTGWLRSGDSLKVIDSIQGWVSPHLQLRFEITSATLVIYRPDGERFYTFVELGQLRQEAEKARQKAENRAQVAENTIKKAISRLLTMGLTPEQVAQALDVPISTVLEDDA